MRVHISCRKRFLTLSLTLFAAFGMMVSLLGASVASASDAGDTAELPRRGMIGIRVDAQADGPVEILDIMPGGAAALAGLQRGDVIRRLGDTEIASAGAFLSKAARLTAGVPTPVIVVRGGQNLTLTLTPLPRPEESMAGAQVTFGQVRLSDGTGIRTITTVPEESELAKRKRHPVVLLVQGIPCSSIETLGNPDHPYSQIISRLNTAGFVTLRVEKPGVGDSQGAPCADGGFNREMEAFNAAVAVLKERRDVDAERLYAIGISMGGIQAPLVAQSHRLAGIVTFGTGVQPWFDYTVNNFRERWLLQGQDPAQIDATMRLWRKYFALMLILEQSPARIAEEHPELVAALRPILGSDLERFAGRHYTFHQELDDQDLATAWGRYQGDVLAVHGEYDWVASRNDHATIVQIVQKHGPGEARFEIIPAMDHGFTTHESLEASFQNAFQGGASTAFYDMAVEWLSKKAEK